jgi:mannobiose 2-epimerase
MDKIVLKQEMTAELERILSFWMRETLDEKNGGFLGEIDVNNIPLENAPKGAILNARILWAFSSAYLTTQNPDYLTTASRAYKYIVSRFLDPDFGGVYWEVDALGRPLNTRKQFYALAFTMYGLVEYHRACGNKDALGVAIELFEVIEKYSFVPEQNGYIEARARDWSLLVDVRLSEKDENAPLTMNTHLHILEAYTNLFRVWKDDNLAAQLKNLIVIFLDKIIVNETANFGLFFDNDWNMQSHKVSYGHNIEGSWLLHEAAEVLGDKLLLKRTEAMAIRMAKVTAVEGLAADFSILNELNEDTGHLDEDRHWWPQAEGIVGFYNAYQLTSDEKFLTISANIWDYTKSHLLDTTNGEWFWRVDARGNTYPDDCKVGFWKCPYHNGRACLEIMNRIVT